LALVKTSKGLAVLLATAGSGGTIAAVRELGKKRHSVAVIASRAFSASSWSNFATRSYLAPQEKESQLFLERLLAIGASDPGQILLPTSDETTWLYTVHADELKTFFRLYQPSIETIRRILDKDLLGESSLKAGISILPSWSPSGINDVVELAESLPYPILIKPRTHVHRIRDDKGVVVYSARELIDQYQKVINRESFRSADSSPISTPVLPLLQQFVEVRHEGVISVTGFIDPSAELFVTRCSTKIFQRLGPVGVGTCFESLPPIPSLSESVRRLCMELRYFGIFEAEFIRFNNDWALIDFNPRLFNQIAMDVRRGMPLPLMACLGAAGQTSELRDAVAHAQIAEDLPTVFCDSFTLRAILLAKTLSFRSSPEERTHWRDWRRKHAAHIVDFAFDRRDPMPGLIHALSETYLGMKSIRRFLRDTPWTLSKKNKLSMPEDV
jgi:predicted ATP-grasp superfamily ATP-dependent carboligase